MQAEFTQDVIDAFYNGEIEIMAHDPGDEGVSEMIRYEPDNFLYNISPKGGLIRLPKGGWTIMDAIVPEILYNIPGPIVEIGMGESSEILANHAHQNSRKLYSCDLQMGGMFNAFDKPLFDGHICFIGKSEEFIKGFKETPAIVFIDGEHTYETVKMEVDYFLPKLVYNGVMFMHDTFPHSFRLTQKDENYPVGQKPEDIYRVRQELERNPDIDVLTWPYTAQNVGLTMVLKHPPNKKRQDWKRNGRVVRDDEGKRPGKNTPLYQSGGRYI